MYFSNNRAHHKTIRFYVILWSLAIPFLGLSQTPGNYPFFLLEGEVLQEVKEQTPIGPQKGIPTELVALLLEGDKKLKEGPYSVTHKKQLPPSGDKHDYTSMGPYWWPDSEKEDGLPYIRRDGEINPEYYDYKDKEELGKLMDALKNLSKNETMIGL